MELNFLTILILLKIFQEADVKLNFKISNIILNGPENDLKLTQNTQPAILIVSYSIFSVLKKNLILILNLQNILLGTIGRVQCFSVLRVLSFTDALHLLFERGKSMQEAVPLGKGSMIAVLGSEINEIKDSIKRLKLKVYVKSQMIMQLVR